MDINLTGKVPYTVKSDDGEYSIKADIKSYDGIDTVRIVFDSAEAMKPPVIELYWEIASVDIQGSWHPTAMTERGIPTVWSGYLTSDALSSSPLYCLYSSGEMNRMTYACSDAMNQVKYRFVLREEDSHWLCSTKLFDVNIAPLSHYECYFRIDYRCDVRYDDAISDVVSWWEKMPEYKPMAPVDECTHPVYSTWYSFHQMAYGDEIEEVLESAAPLGFKAVIVDDGWQMADYSRTYAYCGDWEVAPEKIPDMKAHVKKVHDMGLKYYLWYSVPFVGIHSKAYERFKGKYLRSVGNTYILDPRYPDVREYLISTYENAVRNWDLDGFKLDFVDNFRQPENDDPDSADGRDFVSVPLAVDKLLTEIKLRLQTLKPDIAIEFRQRYVGPLMRKYANMFRAADCANDTVTNKIRTIDTKLCVGASTVHSDMITWHKEDTPEAVALQFINTMFSVPQISVRPFRLPESHRKVMKAWIMQWEEYRETLLYGKFHAQNPELLYTAAFAESERQYVAAAFASNIVIPAPQGRPARIFVANGSGNDGVLLKLNSGKGNYTVLIRNVFGEECGRSIATHDSVSYLNIPVGGTAQLTLEC